MDRNGDPGSSVLSYVLDLYEPMPRSILFLVLLLFPVLSFGTHNRAGDITYRHISGNTYEVTVTTCTKTSAPADREYITLRWGDGSQDSVKRDNINFLPDDAQVNRYTARHTYSGAGQYTISMEDPNRNSGVVNINNSVNTSFCIRTTLIISPFFGHNNSVRFSNRSCNELTCFGDQYCLNLGAWDPDGDSLVYSLVKCRGENCQELPSYRFPDEVEPGADNEFTIDQATGELCWDSPQKQGEYNIAVHIEEYRNGAKVGDVTRDMQIKVVDCNNDPPEIKEIPDTCVVAGDSLDFLVTATDPNPGQTIKLKATGDPFREDPDSAIFPHGVSNIDSVSGRFVWGTTCNHVQKDPYLVTFIAEDNGLPVPRKGYENFFIRVVAPPPKNPSAQPSGNNIELSWSPDSCSWNNYNCSQDSCLHAIRYDIYRRKDSSGFVPDHCQTGVPGSTGYTKIGAANGRNDTTYTDSDDLTYGDRYCYMIVAVFPDGAESYASIEVCTELKRDVPIITHASVGKTDPTNGIDTVRWGMPTELDTITQYPGPYQYKIYRDTGFTSGTTLIGSTPTSNSLAGTDTTFIDSTAHNTQDHANTYRIELYSNNSFVGETTTASSPFLSLSPDDQELELSWKADVPWTNYRHKIYRLDTTTGQYIFLDSTQSTSYIDSGLVNGREYCYYVKTIGEYNSSGLVNPIYNYSQKNCKKPMDLTPPCPPRVAVDADCEAGKNTLSFAYPDTCKNDVARFNVYYAPEKGDSLTFLKSVAVQDTPTTHGSLQNIAGCFEATAVDSNNNESARGNQVCVDNCPEYELPNVFTPNGDGNNDRFIPFPYRYIDKIDMDIYNRWGQVVFHTEDPDILWDGTHRKSGEPVPEGVYYYVVKVDQTTLNGIEEVVLKGQLQLLRDGKHTQPK